jgi:hypothetical protein
MHYAKYLQLQLADFIDSYKKYFYETFGTTIVCTLVAMAFVSVLWHFNLSDQNTSTKQPTMVSYFFARHSYNDNYNIIDIARAAYIFMFSLFSLTLVRLQQNNTESAGFNFYDFLKVVQIQEAGYLLVALAACALADYGLFKMTAFASTSLDQSPVGRWLYGIVYLVRTYLPLLIFTYSNHKILTNGKASQQGANWLYVFTTIWLCNVVAMDVWYFIRYYLFDLLLLPFPDTRRFLFESILSVPLIASFFLGYHSAITNSMQLLTYDAAKNVFNDIEALGQED